MSTLVTGATGTIGTHLLPKISDDVVVTSRNPEKARGAIKRGRVVGWDSESALSDDALADVDVVYHLAGEPVAEGRWTDDKKERIIRSRVSSTRALVEAMARRPKKPRVLVCGSAVGIYGSRGDEVLTEDSPPGSDFFLASVCKAWEAEAARAEEYGIRVVSVRTGVVLAREGGALPALVPLFKSGFGGTLGDGQQWMPWIHIADIVGLLQFAAKDERVRGPLNGSAPEPVTNTKFARAMGAVLHRPTRLPAPAFAVRLAMGEKAEMVLASQRVVPHRALALGHGFEHTTLDGALGELFDGPTRSATSIAAPSDR